jgi:hypothetical protein
MGHELSSGLDVLEFFAEAVQRRLMEWGIKFRPTKPRSPHLNGKIERTHEAARKTRWQFYLGYRPGRRGVFTGPC